MRSAGTLQVRIVKHAFDIVHLLTDSNPIQVLVDAIINRWALLNVSVAAWHIQALACAVAVSTQG